MRCFAITSCVVSVLVASQARADGALSPKVLAEIKDATVFIHIEKDKEVVWRVVANREGRYNLSIVGAGQPASKQVTVSEGLARVSPIRLRDSFWERILSSAEPALPNDSLIQSIAITYPPRNVTLAGWKFNWIVLFFVISLVAGFIFKTVLRIQV